MIEDRKQSSKPHPEQDRLSAVLCVSGTQDTLAHEDYIKDSLHALGIDSVECTTSELLYTLDESKAKILAISLDAKPSSAIDDAKVALREFPDIQHIKFFQNKDTVLTVDDRIQIAEIQNAFLYDTDASFVKIWNDLKYHYDEFDATGLNVLLVDDSMTEAYQTKMILSEAGFVVNDFTSPLEAYKHLSGNTPDIIVVDLHMPEMNGDTFVRLIRQHPKFIGLPVVYLSNETDGAVRNRAVSQGADDFLNKPVNQATFPAYITNRIIRAREQKVKMDCDSLTGLLNHSAILDEIEHAKGRADIKSISVIMLDIDHFKSVNDTYGHQTGDVVIRAIAVLLTRMLREGDLIGRFGGEEFLVALPNTSNENANIIMDRILSAFRELVFDDEKGRTFNCSFSAGVAHLEMGGDIEATLAEADKALYAAKGQGRNRVVRAS